VADEDGDGTVTAGELEDHVEREVASEAGLDGRRQNPRLYREGRRGRPLDGEARGPWLPNASVAARAEAGGRP
jgi:hypothetical protein